MKRLLVVIALLFSAPSFSQPVAAALAPSPVGIIASVGYWLVNNGPEDKQYQVSVISYATTEKAAREEGFRVATEYAVGQFVLSETEVGKNGVKRRDYTNYSAGYVRAYTVKRKTVTESFITLEMDVVISPSKVANRLQADAVSKLPVQYNTLNDSSAKGDKVISSVLADYPKKAYKIAINGMWVERNMDRSAMLVIPYTLEWQREYLDALGEVLNTTREEVDYYSRREAVRIEVKYRPDYGLFNKSWSTYTKDGNRVSMFDNVLTDTKIRVTIKDKSGRLVIDQCVDNVGDFVQSYNSNIIVDGNHKETKRAVQVPVGDNVDDFDNLQLAVVRGYECGKQPNDYAMQARVRWKNEY